MTISAPTVLAAVESASPVAPADRTALLAFSLTTAEVEWDGDAEAGETVRSPNLAAIVQELVDSYGDLSAIMFVHSDDSSATDGRFTFETYDFDPSNPVRLWIRYQP